MSAPLIGLVDIRKSCGGGEGEPCVEILHGVSLQIIVMEATGRLEHDAVLALCAAGLPVMVINPRQARRWIASSDLRKTNAY
jgi:transposase